LLRTARSVGLTYANSAEKAAETARAGGSADGQPVIAIKADSADPKARRGCGGTDDRTLWPSRHSGRHAGIE